MLHPNTFFFEVLLLISCCCCCLVSCQNGSRRTNHLLVAPNQFVAGTSNKVCISRFGHATSGRAVAQVELLSINIDGSRNRTGFSEPRHIAKTKKSFSEGNGGCFDIFIPKTKHRRAILQLKMRFDKLDFYKVHSRKIVHIQHNANFVLIRTDKSVYRAGETVKFRIIQLKNDLTPLNLPVYRVFVEPPPDVFGGSVVAAQWFNASTQLGIMQKEYKLDGFARQGEWRIVVETQSPNPIVTEQTFLVTEYSLPSFNVKVHHKKNVYVKSELISWQICVLYIHGEAVKGDLHLRVKTDLIYYDNPLEFKFEMNGIDPCVNHSISLDLLASNDTEDKPRAIIAEVSFQESGLKTWKNITATSYVRDQSIKLEFIDVKNTFIKQGLPHEIMIKASDINDAIIVGAIVRLCKKFLHSSESNAQNSPNTTLNDGDGLERCEDVQTDKFGIASFIGTVSVDMNYEEVLLKAFLYHNEKEFNSTLIMTKLRMLKSNSTANMHIGSGKVFSELAEINFPIYFVFPFDILTKRVTLHYLIVTRAGTLHHWGLSSQCVHRVDDIQNIQQEVFARAYYSENSECLDDHAESSVYYKTVLRIKTTPSMCPHSRLIVYFMTSAGDLVVDSRYFKVNQCFSNKIVQYWGQNTVAPGAKTTLTLKSMKTVGPSLCLLESANMALKDILPRRTLGDEIIWKINEFAESRSRKNKIFNSNSCYDESKDTSSEIVPSKSINTVRLFREIGLVLLTDIRFDNAEECVESDNNVYQLERIDFISKKSSLSPERVYFPETWLWETYLMDSNKVLSVPVVVPDEVTQWESNVFCISRAGVAPSRERLLRVFKPLFVKFAVPKTIKRGEDVQLSFKVFNYHAHRLTIQNVISVDPPNSAIVANYDSNKRTCIPSKESSIFHFTLIGQKLKYFNISIRTSTTRELINCAESFNTTYSSTLKLSDIVTKDIQVIPEGFVHRNYKSAIVCANDNSNGMEAVWSFRKHDVVEGSEGLVISIVGDIVGPMMINANKLVALPMGCGEQNVVLLAYNLMALEYLSAQKRLCGDVKEFALNNLMTGYQRQLQFLHPKTGAFSAFGQNDDLGSTWLTAMCIKYFSLLQSKWKIGSVDVIDGAVRWLLSRQMENGCFLNEGQIFHQEMMGGLKGDNTNIALTAFVVISLIEANPTILRPAQIDNIIYCLGALRHRDISQDYISTYDDAAPEDPQYAHTFAIATYALFGLERLSALKGDSYRGFRVLSKRADSFLSGGGAGALVALKRMARRSGDLMWWEGGSLATSIEITSYGILSLLEGGKHHFEDATAAARWLSMHRNPEGGFVSTQDTLIATQALCALRNAIPDIPPILNISLAFDEQVREINVSPQDRYSLQTINFDSASNSNLTQTDLNIRMNGSGCALVQATHTYNKRAPVVQLSPFRLYANVITHGAFSCEYESVWCKCAAALEVCFSWNSASEESAPEMTLIEIQLPTGYSPDRFLLYGLIKEQNGILKRIEEAQDSNTIYLYIAPSSKYLSHNLRDCYNLYLIGPKSPTLPAVVKISDYYKQEVFQSITYTIPEACLNQTSPSGDEPSKLIKLGASNVSAEKSESDLFDVIGGHYATFPSNATLEDRFANWTVTDVETDLDFPDGVEGNYETRVPGR